MIVIVLLGLSKIWELNRSDVTRMVPLAPQLIAFGTHCIIARINRPTGGQQWVMAVPWPPVIGKGGQARVSGEVTLLQDDGAVERGANQIVVK